MSEARFFMRWSEHDIAGLRAIGVSHLLTEARADGTVTREVGLDGLGRVVHRAPSPDDAYGLFDNVVIAETSLRDDLSRDEFEVLWRMGAQAFA